ncbi:precorrin-6y C5,15-methyltransferase (decarboxylating) subunit CbiE [Ruminococcus sp.]|uniref:precorrin-6y C5,15-methyltransferase (decarboxylating) subunit CbiE n=1 Tax=Ruminococcus sp. TaxID=41978 RepID=UPI0025DA41E1|nr:precorrin-6y C5,15-methyltransferase (decarboxylating) subunit CbiE [Ruminococcus sp.]MCR4638118.1 precorrin-6y C5,15-methyltransferase (decarboxylating) subunit CbiE [Ruminococcus sp.]
MKIYIIGIGVNGIDSLTKEAESTIAEASLLIGAERMLNPFSSLGKELFCSYIPKEIAAKLRSCEYGCAAVLMSGDCGFFSGTKKLLPLLNEYDVKVVAGISSAAYFCGKLGISYEQMKFVSLHGQSSNIAVNVRLNRQCFFLLGGDITAAEVCRRLCRYGMGDVTVHIGADLGYPDERVVSGRAENLIDNDICGLAVMITVNMDALRRIPSAISDEEFLRDKVPMTKSEVRCIAVSKMNIECDSVVWDIGCGTGAVSVEAACRCPDGEVLAFDKKAEAVLLTEKNARLFGCDNIIAAEGNCPECLAEAETPDKVFIGGSSGNMSGIFDVIYTKNPNAYITVTAVSLETLSDAVKCFEKYGSSPEIAQISVTRTEKLGTHTMLKAQNPVFIISGGLT